MSASPPLDWYESGGYYGPDYLAIFADEAESGDFSARTDLCRESLA